MGWIDTLVGSSVGVDTSPFIYFFERHPIYLPKLRPFFAAVANAQLQIITSPITVVELLTKPMKESQAQLVNHYRLAFADTFRTATQPTTIEIADIAAELRAKYNLRTPDAIQVATAISTGATTFLTNDKKLKRVNEIAVLTLDDVR